MRSRWEGSCFVWNFRFRCNWTREKKKLSPTIDIDSRLPSTLLAFFTCCFWRFRRIEVLSFPSPVCLVSNNKSHRQRYRCGLAEAENVKFGSISSPPAAGAPFPSSEHPETTKQEPGSSSQWPPQPVWVSGNQNIFLNFTRMVFPESIESTRKQVEIQGEKRKRNEKNDRNDH